MAATEYQEEWDLGCVAMDKLQARPASASSRAATTASSGARTASTRRTSSCSSPTWASRPWRRSSRPPSTAPSCCAWSTETGTIEEGKYADLLVVDGDPLADIAILQDRSKLAHGHEGRQGHGQLARPPAGAHAHPRLHRWTSSTSRAPSRGAPDDADGGRGAALNLELNGDTAHVDGVRLRPAGRARARPRRAPALGGIGEGIWQIAGSVAAGASASSPTTCAARAAARSTPGPYTIDAARRRPGGARRRARARARRARGPLHGRLDRARLRGRAPRARARRRRPRRARGAPRRRRAPA